MYVRSADGVDEKQRLPALGAGAQRRRSSVFVTGCAPGARSVFFFATLTNARTCSADGILLNTKERRKSLSFVVQNEAAAVALAAAAAAAAAAPAAAPAARGDVSARSNGSGSTGSSERDAASEAPTSRVVTAGPVHSGSRPVSAVVPPAQGANRRGRPARDFCNAL